MNKFSNKLKKTLFFAHFGSIFPIFGAKKNFLENLALSCTTSFGFLAPCQNLEKVNDTIQRKCPDRQKDRWKDGQTLFYRTLLATARVPIKRLTKDLINKLSILHGAKYFPPGIFHISLKNLTYF